jgi:hypothetical protein
VQTDTPSAEVPVASDAAAAPAEETQVATAEEAKPSAAEASPAAPETAKVEPDKANTDQPETDKAEPTSADLAMSEAAKPELEVAPAMPAIEPTATRVATLGGPPVATEDGTPRKDVGEKTEQSLEKARLRAQARARRRRLAARARLVRLQQAAALQQPFRALFGQPGPTPASTP